MFTVNTYEEIERIEKELCTHHIIILLFVKPTSEKSREIINEFEYIHYNSERYCSVYAVGYTDDNDLANSNDEYREIQCLDGNSWFFSYKEFVDFKDKLEKRIKWKYSGSIEAIILQSNPSGKEILNFQNYINIDIDNGIKKEYIDSFSSFMESIVRHSKNNTSAIEAMNDYAKSRIKISEIVIDALDDCKNIPTSVKKIIKDGSFYLSTINRNKSKVRK